MRQPAIIRSLAADARRQAVHALGPAVCVVGAAVHAFGQAVGVLGVVVHALSQPVHALGGTEGVFFL